MSEIWTYCKKHNDVYSRDGRCYMCRIEAITGKKRVEEDQRSREEVEEDVKDG